MSRRTEETSWWANESFKITESVQTKYCVKHGDRCEKPDANGPIRPLHDRMPVLLHPHEYDQWLHGSFDDLLGFQQRAFPYDLIEITRTSDLWVPNKVKASNEMPTLL